MHKQNFFLNIDRMLLVGVEKFILYLSLFLIVIGICTFTITPIIFSAWFVCFFVFIFNWRKLVIKNFIKQYKL